MEIVAKQFTYSVCSVLWGCSGLTSARFEWMLAPQSSLTRDDMETRRLAAARELLNGDHAVTGCPQIRRQPHHGFALASGVVVEEGSTGCANGAPRPPQPPHRRTIGLASELYRDGARAAGFSSDRWTTGRLAGAIGTLGHPLRSRPRGPVDVQVRLARTPVCVRGGRDAGGGESGGNERFGGGIERT